MTNAIQNVPRELLEELRDAANDCRNHEAMRGRNECRMRFYEDLTKSTDALLATAQLQAAPAERGVVRQETNFVASTGEGRNPLYEGQFDDETPEQAAHRLHWSRTAMEVHSARLNPAPAAPAADAGLAAVEWAKDAEEWGPALNESGWLFLSELNEDPQKSALIFNSTKGPLRAAIMRYAEIVTAHCAKGRCDAYA